MLLKCRCSPLLVFQQSKNFALGLIRCWNPSGSGSKYHQHWRRLRSRPSTYQQAIFDWSSPASRTCVSSHPLKRYILSPSQCNWGGKWMYLGTLVTQITRLIFEARSECAKQHNVAIEVNNTSLTENKEVMYAALKIVEIGKGVGVYFSNRLRCLNNFCKRLRIRSRHCAFGQAWSTWRESNLTSTERLNFYYWEERIGLEEFAVSHWIYFDAICAEKKRPKWITLGVFSWNFLI